MDKIPKSNHRNENCFKNYFSLSRVVQTIKSVDEISDHFKRKPFDEKYLFITLYKVDLTFESVDETLWVCEHSSGNYRAVLSCGTVYCAVQGGFNVCLWLKFLSACDHSNESY